MNLIDWHLSEILIPVFFALHSITVNLHINRRSRPLYELRRNGISKLTKTVAGNGNMQLIIAVNFKLVHFLTLSTHYLLHSMHSRVIVLHLIRDVRMCGY